MSRATLLWEHLDRVFRNALREYDDSMQQRAYLVLRCIGIGKLYQTSDKATCLERPESLLRAMCSRESFDHKGMIEAIDVVKRSCVSLGSFSTSKDIEGSFRLDQRSAATRLFRWLLRIHDNDPQETIQWIDLVVTYLSKSVDTRATEVVTDDITLITQREQLLVENARLAFDTFEQLYRQMLAVRLSHLPAVIAAAKSAVANKGVAWNVE